MTIHYYFSDCNEEIKCKDCGCSNRFLEEKDGFLLCECGGETER